jgi:hypothetical protein
LLCADRCGTRDDVVEEEVCACDALPVETKQSLLDVRLSDSSILSSDITGLLLLLLLLLLVIFILIEVRAPIRDSGFSASSLSHWFRYFFAFSTLRADTHLSDINSGGVSFGQALK